MSDFDERLRDELERAAGTGPSGEGKFRRVARRRKRRRATLRLQYAALVVVVVAGTAVGTYGLSRAFSGSGKSPEPAGEGSVHNGRIAAVYSQKMNGTIITVNPDGSDPGEITTGIPDTGAPEWSPDASRIAFITGNPDTKSNFWQIAIAGADGSSVHELTTGETVAWSPDGKTLALHDYQHRADMWLIDADGSNRRPLIDQPLESVVGADWSPDGQWVVLGAMQSTGSVYRNGLMVVHPDGSGLSWLGSSGNDGLVEPWSPSWSPDGTQIAYVQLSHQPTANVVHVLDLGTGQDRVLDIGIEWVNFPTWSPDGTQIAFMAPDGERESLWVMNADGTGAHAIADLGHGSVMDLTRSGISWAAIGGPAPAPSVSISPALLEPIAPPPGPPDPHSPEPGRAAGLTGNVLVETYDAMHVDSEIDVMGPDGSMRTLIDSPDRESDAHWSPDGSKVMFMRTPAPQVQPDGSTYSSGAWPNELVVADASGRNEQVFLRDANIGSPVWSPDGASIAYLKSDKTGNNLWIMDADGSHRHQITDGYTVNAPSWSPDGSSIVFASDAYTNGETGQYAGMDVYTVNVDGSDLQRLTENLVYDQYPVWSPDGSTIAFIRSTINSDGQWDLYVMNADGANVRQLTAWPGMEGPPVWSPDGSMIMFGNTQRDDDPATEIYVVSPGDESAGLVLDPNQEGDITPTDWKT